MVEGNSLSICPRFGILFFFLGRKNIFSPKSKYCQVVIATLGLNMEKKINTKQRAKIREEDKTCILMFKKQNIKVFQMLFVKRKKKEAEGVRGNICKKQIV